MRNLDVQLWIWLFNSTLVVGLAAWAIIDGVRDIRYADRYNGTEISAAELRNVAYRHIRNGVLTFALGNIAGSLATIYVLGRYTHNLRWMIIFERWLPYALNVVLGLVLLMLLWDRYERWNLLHPEHKINLRQWRRLRCFKR